MYYNNATSSSVLLRYATTTDAHSRVLIVLPALKLFQGRKSKIYIIVLGKIETTAAAERAARDGENDGNVLLHASMIRLNFEGFNFVGSHVPQL